MEIKAMIDSALIKEILEHGPTEPKPEITGTVHKVQRGPEDDGIRFGVHVEGTSIILDFGQPIQYLGLTMDDMHKLIMGLVATGALIEAQQETNPIKVN